MALGLDLDELVADWTLVGDEVDLVAGKRGATRLRFALLLKFYGRHGRFFEDLDEVSDEIVDYVARQVQISADTLGGDTPSERTRRFHQSQIREHFGFRECSTPDADRAVEWLSSEVCERERVTAAVREELLAWFRRERIEPPSSGRVDRVVRAALHRGEMVLSRRVTERLSVEVRQQLDDLITHPDDVADGEGVDDVSPWSVMLAEPGDVSLNTLLVEIDKLNAARFVGVPAGVLDDVAPGMVERWRTRAAVESPSHLRTHPGV